MPHILKFSIRLCWIIMCASCLCTGIVLTLSFAGKWVASFENQLGLLWVAGLIGGSLSSLALVLLYRHKEAVGSKHNLQNNSPKGKC